MKKLNNFILFPLILGTTCLVCGGVVSAINYAVSGKIAENSSGKVAKTIKSVFVGSKEVKLVYDTTSDDPALNTNPKPFDSHIVQYYSVVTADEKTGHAYLLKSDKGYSGTITVLACFLDNNMIGLSYIEGDEDSLGVSAVNKLASYVNQGNPYVSGSDFSSFTTSAGASAKSTLPVLEKAINAALADISVRSSDLNFNITTEVSFKEEGFDYVTYSVKTTAGDTDDYDDQYQNLEGEFTFVYSINEASYKLYRINVTKHSSNSEDDYGSSILDGTATDAFTQTLIAPAISGDGVDLSKYSQPLAAVASDKTYFTSDSKALGTAYTLYSMIYEAGQNFTAYNKETNAAIKIDDTHYRARVFNGTYGKLDLVATIDPVNRTVLSVEYKAYSAVAYYDNFGVDIIKGNTNSANTKRNDFVKNYVKFPAEGLSFDTFKNVNIDEVTVGTGATFTASGYLQAMQLIVAEFEKGAN